MQTKMMRIPAVVESAGNSRSDIYMKIRDGLFVPPVSIGARSVAWPSVEVDAINEARVAGKTDDEIRALVQRLVAARKRAHKSHAGKSATRSEAA